jgi:glyoxylase-like metal-dependent hydrolase (beta-lactamase superfamily II)
MKVSDKSFHFRVGKLECMVVSDGTLSYTPPIFPPPATFLFTNAPRERLGQVLRQHDLHPEQWAEWVSPYICMVINTGEYRVLVDTGGDGLGPNTGKLLENLRGEGIEPENIDVVILTHGHPDHIGGNTDSDGRPAFPNARYLMWRGEWDFWTSEEAGSRLDEHVREVLVGFAHRNLPPIQGQLDLVDREAEIMPGVRAIAAPGHTPGHMALNVYSGGAELLCVSDTVLHPIHLEQPEWYAAVDLDPEQVVETRCALLNRAAAEKSLVLAFHFPFPGLGHVVRKDEAWQWQPIETTG